MKGLLLVILTTVACGRVGFEESMIATDAQGGDPVDASVVEADADLSPPRFGAPRIIPELRVPGVAFDDPSLTGDMLEIYLKAKQGGALAIYSATRASLADPWSTPAPVVELASAGDEDTPEVSANGLTLYLASDRGGNMDLYLSTRANRAQPWSAPARVSELSSVDDDYSAVRSADELNLVSSRIVGDVDLYFASRASVNDPWGAPLPLSTINADGRESDATLDATGLRMYYTVDGPGTEIRDIYYASRSSLGDTFTPAVPVAELNSPAHDEDPWVSPDLAFIYFSRNDGGNTEILLAERTP